MNARRFKSGPAGVAAIAAMLAGCSRDYPMTTMAPKSDLGQAIYSLMLEVTGWDLLILAIVIVAFTLAVFFFSTRVGEAGPPSSAASSLGLEVAWTMGPALILLFIAIPTVREVFRSQPRAPVEGELAINVVAHQWWWEFRYDDGTKIVTANELHLPANRPIRLRLVSQDVIHSLWVPVLGGKRDVVPGQVNQINLIAHQPGEYYGQCAEFCGLSHANMRFRVFVDPPAEFATWEVNQEAPSAIPAVGTPAAIGAREFANSPCTTCHTIKGVSTGYVGPDLTHLASRTTIAGAIAKNDPKVLTQWITHPSAMKPGAQMPDFGLRGEQLDDLVAYLESLK